MLMRVREESRVQTAAVVRGGARRGGNASEKDGRVW